MKVKDGAKFYVGWALAKFALKLAGLILIIGMVWCLGSGS